MSVYCSGTRAAQQQLVFAESFYVYGSGSTGSIPYGYADLRSYGSGWRWISFELTGTRGTTTAGGGYGMLNDGARIYGTSFCEGYPLYSYGSVKVYPPGSGNSPYITATYENAVLYAAGVSPASGYVDNHGAITFSWTPKTDAKTIDPLSQASAVFRWKNGASGTVHTVNVGTDEFVTLAADTLPNSSEIMWQVQLTSDDGVQDPSPVWYTITTIDVTPTVTGISPSGGYVSGSDTATFRWNYDISTGTQQSAWELQVKAAADDNWTDYASGSTSDTEVTVSGSGLPSGNAMWRVRGANSDGVWSDWSDPLTYVTVAPPRPPVVSITERTARPVVTWTSSDQQAFRVNIGDYDSGIVFGTDKTFKCPVYLKNGEITIRVKVVNDLNLWSDWGETVFQLSAAQGTAPTLYVTGGVSAGLSWTTSDSPDGFLVYRDGVLIGETAELTFTDQLAAPGYHSWFVRSVYDGSDAYADSAAVQAEIAVGTNVIAEIGGEWIDIGLSAVQAPTETETRGAAVAMLTLAGAVYPVPEVGPQRTRTMPVSFATLDPAAADRFCALEGKIVVCKTRHGRQIIGIMPSITRGQNWAMTTCSAVIQEVDPSAYR